jgi:hypothetical protein
MPIQATKVFHHTYRDTLLLLEKLLDLGDRVCGLDVNGHFLACSLD